RVMGSEGGRTADLGEAVWGAVLLQQVRIAVVLMAGAALQAHDQAALDQPRERRLDTLEAGERVHALAPLLELPGRLGPAKHEHAQDRAFGVVHRETLGEQMPVLRGPAARTAREPHEP